MVNRTPGGRPTTTRRGETLTLYSWLVSPYSAKLRSFLHFHGIAYNDVRPSALQLNYTLIKPAVGRAIMPTIRTSTGSWLQDSTIICDDLDASSTVPSTLGGAQRIASLLIELLADEWLPLLTLHWRWNIAGNAAFAIDEFAANSFPLLPLFISRRLAAQVAESMKVYRPIVGISDATIPGIETYTAMLIATLDAHLSCDETPFLLGGRPCRGDFALSAALWAHLYRDPHTRYLFDDAPAVALWLERLHTAASGDAPLPRRPNPAAGAPSAPPRVATMSAREVATRLSFLAPDRPDGGVPRSLDPIFTTLFDETWPFLRRASDALDAWIEGNADTAVNQRVPRGLGWIPLTVGGGVGRRRIVTFQLWKAQRPRDALRSLRERMRQQPSSSAAADELGRATRWLRRVGGLDALGQHHPAFRLLRSVEGARGEELRFVRAPPQSGSQQQAKL